MGLTPRHWRAGSWRADGHAPSLTLVSMSPSYLKHLSEPDGIPDSEDVFFIQAGCSAWDKIITKEAVGDSITAGRKTGWGGHP